MHKSYDTKGGDVGLATMFNHNTYCNEPRGHALRGNMFLRASSIGTQWRGDAPVGAFDIVVDDNFIRRGRNRHQPGGKPGQTEFVMMETAARKLNRP